MSDTPTTDAASADFMRSARDGGPEIVEIELVDAECARKLERALRKDDEITEAMLNAARDWSAKKYGKPIGNDAAIGCYTAMRAAMKPPMPTPTAPPMQGHVLGKAQ